MILVVGATGSLGGEILTSSAEGKAMRHPTRASRVLLQLLVGLTVVTAGTAAAQVAISSVDAARRAQSLLRQMTLEEKIGQLNLAAGVTFGGTITAASDTDIMHGRVGAILWLADPKEMNRLQHLAVEQSRLHIPLLFGLDVIHGYHTLFPIPLGMASSWDPAVEEQAQAVAAKEARSAGIRWTFTPMVDIARDARWGRIQEGAGEDPYLGAAMARAQVRGFQGAHLGPTSVVACAKHFAGYGAAEGGRDYDGSYVPEALMRNVYLAPFHAAVQAGVGSLMSAYMDLNDVPASANHWLLTDVLRKDWGFRGFLTSDAFAIASLQVHGFAADPRDAAYKAITAGAGMDMASQTVRNHLAQLVASGNVSPAQIDAAVLPILEVKVQIGLFDHPYASESGAGTAVGAEGRSLARSLGARSMVLLKNDHHALPLSNTIRNVAVIGALADSPGDITGGPTPAGFFLQTHDAPAVTVLAALKSRLGPEAHLTYVPGPAMSKVFLSMVDGFLGQKALPPPTPAEVADWQAKAKAAAEQADLVIAVIGEPAFMSGEGASRGTLDLPGIQAQMVEAAAASGKPLVVVLENGRPLDITWLADHAAAILESWFPGVDGGNAVVDVLFGDVNPGGKLPVSWPRSAGQEPVYYNHNLTHAPESDPQFTSRYWDVASKPLYPFGYGLSYTTFRFANLHLSKTRMKTGDSVEVVVDVTNTGSVRGDAVAQLYIHQRSGSASRPVRQLEGFRRVTLQPGETVPLRFALRRSELQFWSPQTTSWVVEPSSFDVWVGEDSRADLHAEFTVEP
ncbi:MAG TPA: beta-glucosidase BglX [Gemmatimonadales bacterium]|jgi:beta-glucosidase|nr:beta-glucosidase BglX [Gemmatimonadales bacterium]